MCKAENGFAYFIGNDKMEALSLLIVLCSLYCSMYSAMKKIILPLFLGLFAMWFFTLCKSGETTTQPDTYLNLQDSVDYVGMATCRSCHANIHETFAETGMGRSWHFATPEKSDASFGDHALVYNKKSDFYYFPYFKNDELYVLEFRLENGDTVHQRSEKISYIVGSGQHTNSHIINENGYIYQAPVTWYAQDKKWDMAPGFTDDNLRFSRLLTDECITCHNHYPTMPPGSLNKFTEMPTGIECERCHGPGEIHVKEKLAGNIVDTSQFIDYSIVNPSDLPRDLQMDLCQRCHLQGTAVVNEGKTFFDFKPGMKLNEVMNVYLPRFTDSHEQFIMASQADRMRLSECFKNSDMTCLSCHHPHHSVEATPKEQYNGACKNCHGENKSVDAQVDFNKKCTAPMADREANGDDCSACHMPKSGSIDIPHVRITDHFIRAHNSEAEVATQEVEKQFLGIEILTKDNPTHLDMARGYLAVYDKYVAAPVMLDSAAFYIGNSPASFREKLPLLIHLHINRGDHGWITQTTSSVKLPVDSMDAWTAYRIGEAYYQTADYKNALRYFEQAVSGLPLHLDFMEKQGLALANLQRTTEAEKVFRKVLSENTKRPVALTNLGFIKVLDGNILEAEKLYDQAIDLDPDYPQALVNKAALLIFKKDKKGGKKLLERVLEIDPENAQAKQGLAVLNG